VERFSGWISVLQFFNLQTAPVGIRGTAGAVGIPGAVGILDRVRRIRRAVAAVGVTGRVGVVRVRAQLAPVLTLLIVEPRCICGERIRRRLIAEGTAVGAEEIVQAVRLEGAASPEGRTLLPPPEFLSSIPHYHYDDP
jgi:hypothetical protein